MTSYHPHPALPLKGEGKGGGGKRKFLSNQIRHGFEAFSE